jgi:SAM-dependent methyltransferase
MAQAGAQVVATDFSAVFLERAKERTKAVTDQMEFHLIDATNEAELLSLGKRRFDAAVSNMALMDMPTIAPLFTALSRLLKVGGRFVFTVMHPSFNNSGCSRVIEETDSEGEIVLTYAMKITRYLTIEAVKGTGIRGQPIPQYYFHRPLQRVARCRVPGRFRAGRSGRTHLPERNHESARPQCRQLPGASSRPGRPYASFLKRWRRR